MSQPTTIAQAIDNSTVSAKQWAIVGICFVLNVLDGYDIVAMSVVAPTLSKAWQLSPIEIGYILSAALVGMTIGAAAIGQYADRYGRRILMLSASLSTAIAMAVTAMVPAGDWMLLVVVRFWTGLGIGVLMASTTAITSEYSPNRLRNFLVPVVIMGYAVGATLAGPAANYLIPHYDWQSVFIAGAIATLALTALMAIYLPESLNFLVQTSANRAALLPKVNAMLVAIKCQTLEKLPKATPVTNAYVSELFKQDRTKMTLKLWVAFFCGLFTMYLFLGWTPSLYVGNDYSRTEGINALTLFNIGGLIGITTIGYITTKFNLVVTVALSLAVSAVLMALFWLTSVSEIGQMNIALLLIGLFFQSGFTAMYTVASRCYPDVIRATGVGWAIGLGRTGAIAAPIVAGWLVLKLDLDIYQLVGLQTVPTLVAAAMILSLRKDISNQ